MFIPIGKHPCLFCHIPKEQLKIPKEERDQHSKRTLETLIRDFETFESYGKDTKKAKFCNNVINQTLFNVPLSQVLGLFRVHPKEVFNYYKYYITSFKINY